MLHNKNSSQPFLFTEVVASQNLGYDRRGTWKEKTVVGIKLDDNDAVVDNTNSNNVNKKKEKKERRGKKKRKKKELGW